MKVKIFDLTPADLRRAMAEGPEGPPGEVTQQALDDEIATTALNPSGVTSLGMTVSNPPTQAEVQALTDKLDELIGALVR